MKTRNIDPLHWGMLFALLLVTALAVDQRNKIKVLESRIRALNDTIIETDAGIEAAKK